MTATNVATLLSEFTRASRTFIVREVARERLDGCQCRGAGKPITMATTSSDAMHTGTANTTAAAASGSAKHHEHDLRPRSVNEGAGSRVPHKHHDIHHEHERRDLCRARIQHVGGAADDAHKVGRLEPQLVEKTCCDKPPERRVHEQPPLERSFLDAL